MASEFENMFDTGLPGKGDLGQQRSRRNFKFHPEIPAISLSPSPQSEFRAYPAIDAAAGKLQPYVDDGKITWIKFMYTIDYAGIIVTGDDGKFLRDAYSFWLIPSDMDTYFAEEIGKLTTTEDRERCRVRNAPYSLLYYAASNSDQDPHAARDWAPLTSRDDWANVMGVNPKGQRLYTPMPRPEEHALILGQLLLNGGTRDKGVFVTKTYDDGRSPGSLHPVVLELKKSATQALKTAILRGGGGDVGDGVQVTGDLADSQTGQVILVIAENRQSKGENSRPYNVHTIALRDGARPIDLKEIAREWQPWTEEVKCGQDVRKPLLRLLTIKDQISLLIRAFGPELIGYAFKDTQYEKELSNEERAAFAQFSSSAKGTTTWYELMRSRLLRAPASRQAGSGTQAQNAPSGGQVNAPVGQTKERIAEILANAAGRSDDMPGGVNTQQSEELFSVLDSDTPAQTTEAPVDKEATEPPDDPLW